MPIGFFRTPREGKEGVKVSFFNQFFSVWTKKHASSLLSAFRFSIPIYWGGGMKSIEISGKYENKLSSTPVFTRLHSLILMMTDII